MSFGFKRRQKGSLWTPGLTAVKTRLSLELTRAHCSLFFWPKSIYSASDRFTAGLKSFSIGLSRYGTVTYLVLTRMNAINIDQKDQFKQQKKIAVSLS